MRDDKREVTMSTVIKNGTVLAADRTYEADLLVEGERISAIGDNLKGDNVLDAEDAYIVPGGIDPHTHLEMPFMGTTAAETWESGTFAALSGGTTTVVDFVIPGPGGMMTALKEWQQRAARQASSDYSFHMCVTGWSQQHFDQMAQVVDQGINTFKHFMAYKGALMVNDDEMFASFRRCAELGAMPLVHAENGDVVAALQAKLMAQGITGPEGHAWSRPPQVEGEAANRAIMIADMAGVPLYIVHVSCKEAHHAIARARAEGKRVYGEPLVQHLVLDETEYFNSDWDHAARRVMSPPFRNKENQEDLWNGLRAGSLQVVATDHCAFTTEQKRFGVGDFTKIPNGTGGLEDRLSLLWTAGVATGRLTKEEFVAVTSANIARILNIYPRKGAVAVGSDADIIVFDPAAGKTISARSQLSRIDYNVFEGFECLGAPIATLSRGKIAFAQGDLRAEKGDGKYIERPPFSPVHVANSTWKQQRAPQAVRRAEVTP